MKKWILSHKILSIVIACVIGAGAVCAVVLPIVLSDKHEFSTDWTADESYHWHECTTKNHTDATEKLPHEFNDGVVTTEPSAETEGVKTFTCKTCGYSYTQKIEALPHTHEYDANAWVNTDESGHYRPTTCGHADKTKDFAAHTFDEGEVTKPEGYGTVGEKTYTCTVCGFKRIAEIPALEAKNNVISFAEDLVVEKTYDGLEFIVDPAKVSRKGDGEISVTYKGEDDDAFSATAPTNAGEYTVKATVKGTAEWKGGEITATITINKCEVTLPAGVFERKLGENLESGKFGLTCIDVKEAVNNVVEWVTIGAPETYYTIGIHTIGAAALTVDNDNFELNKGDYDAVKFTVWNAPDCFYAGIQDVFSFSGRTELAITTKIANGTVKKGDQLLVNEIGKIITVKKIEKGTGTSATEVETATAGEEVGLLIEGATKAELKRGYMLSELDKIIGYSKVTATIRSYTKGEGGQHTPIATGIKPNIVFADTFGDAVIGEVTFPEGTDLLMPGETLEGVTIDFRGEKVPAFVGRRFRLRTGGGTTVAECIVTAVPHATRIRSGRMFGVKGVEVIEPVELGETTFAVNLSRSDVGNIIKNVQDTDEIIIDFYANGKTIGKYTRTPVTGEGVYNEVGGKIVGSYLIVDFYGSAGYNLTDHERQWIFTGEDIYIGIGAYTKPASGSGT